MAALSVLCSGGIVGADAFARGRAEADVADRIQRAVDGLQGPPSVTIEGTPFLTQYVYGEIGSMRAQLDSFTVDDVVVRDVEVDASTVRTEGRSRAQAGSLVLTGRIPVDVFVPRIEKELKLPVDLGTDGDALTVSLELLGRRIGARLEPQVVDGAVSAQVVAVTLDDQAQEIGALPERLQRVLGKITDQINRLPDGIRVEEVEVLPGALHVRLVGQDVALG